MATGTSRTSSSSNSLGLFWKRELFNDDAFAAFNRVRNATKPGSAVMSTTSPASFHADIATIYRAITVNKEIILRLAKRQEDLKEESALELNMKGTLELEVERLKESLAIHEREIKNIGFREEIRQHKLAELKDLGLVMLVQALREETPEEWKREMRSGEDAPG